MTYSSLGGLLPRIAPQHQRLFRLELHQHSDRAAVRISLSLRISEFALWRTVTAELDEIRLFDARAPEELLARTVERLCDRADDELHPGWRRKQDEEIERRKRILADTHLIIEPEDILAIIGGKAFPELGLEEFTRIRPLKETIFDRVMPSRGKAMLPMHGLGLHSSAVSSTVSAASPSTLSVADIVGETTLAYSSSVDDVRVKSLGIGMMRRAEPALPNDSEAHPEWGRF